MLESKLKIIRSTIQIVHENGLEHAATAKIAKKAGVATGTLFHHFPHKSSLFEAVHQYILDDYVFHLMGFFDYPEDQIGRQLKKAIKASIDYWSRNPNFFSFMNQMVHSGYYTSARAAIEESYIEKQLGYAFKTAIRKKVIKRYDPKILLRILLKSIFEISDMILKVESKELKKRYRQQGVAFILTALNIKKN